MKSKTDVKGINPSKLFEFHEATRDAMAYSILKQEAENIMLKQTINECEMALLPSSFFIKPNSIVKSMSASKDILESNSRIEATSSLMVIIW